MCNVQCEKDRKNDVELKTKTLGDLITHLEK